MLRHELLEQVADVGSIARRQHCGFTAIDPVEMWVRSPIDVRTDSDVVAIDSGGNEEVVPLTTELVIEELNRGQCALGSKTVGDISAIAPDLHHHHGADICAGASHL